MDSNLDKLFDEIHDCPEGPTRISLLEEAIRLADLEQNEETAFEMRILLIQDCIFFGQQLKALTAFSWCIARVREDKFDLDEIIWEYKWICSVCSDFYEISREKCGELLADYKKCLSEAGYGLHSYWTARLNQSLDLNDMEMADEAYKNILSSKRDHMSDCSACVQDTLVHYQVSKNNYDEALRLATPILSGKMKCAEVPHITYSNLLVPALMNGDTEAAASYALKGYKLISRNPEFTGNIGSYLIYWACTDIDKALKTYIKHLEWLNLPFTMAIRRKDFSIGAYILFKKLAKDRDTIKMLLPKNFPLYREDGEYKTADIIAYHFDVATTVAKALDKRNSNDGCTKGFTRIVNFTEGL